jgi:hypothetical protein
MPIQIMHNFKKLSLRLVMFRVLSSSKIAKLREAEGAFVFVSFVLLASSLLCPPLGAFLCAEGRQAG